MSNVPYPTIGQAVEPIHSCADCAYRWPALPLIISAICPSVGVGCGMSANCTSPGLQFSGRDPKEFGYVEGYTAPWWCACAFRPIPLFEEPTRARVCEEIDA